ncbi:TPA: hypothetical protein ACGO3A_000510 [Streptococcus suis]
MSKKLEKYSKSREAISSQVELFLSLFIFSIIAVIKGVVEYNSEFQYMECLSISMTSFLIMFISFFSKEDIFEEWKKGFKNHSKKEKLFFLFSPIVLIIMLLGTVVLVKIIDFIPSSLYELSDFPLTFNFFKYTFWLMKLLWVSLINFIGYYLGSLLLAMEWLFISAYSYDFLYSYISNKIKNK